MAAHEYSSVLNSNRLIYEQEQNNSLGDCLLHGRTNPRHQITMAPRKFMVTPCIFNSNHSWPMCVFAILKFMAQYDCIIHLPISGRKTDFQHCLRLCNDVHHWWTFVSSSGTKIGLRADWKVTS
jgi:hypothetical protein